MYLVNLDLLNVSRLDKKAKCEAIDNTLQLRKSSFLVSLEIETSKMIR